MGTIILNGANGNGMAKYNGDASVVLYHNSDGLHAVRRSGSNHTFKATYFTDFLSTRGSEVLLCAYNINDEFYRRCSEFARSNRHETTADISEILK